MRRDEVWKTAPSDVPGLLAQIEPLLPTEPTINRS
jgi:hypothetical protein